MRTRRSLHRVTDSGTRAALLYTVEEYFGLVERGLLDADDRVELLNGVITAKVPQSPRHSSAIARGRRELGGVFGEGFVVREQMPLLVGGVSVPEPDLAVVAGRLEDFEDRHPDSAVLVIEVAVTSLPLDRLTKQRLYAASGIGEHWIVNLPDRVVEVLRQPSGAGYASYATAHPGEEISPLAGNGRGVAVAALLPAPPAGR